MAESGIQLIECSTARDLWSHLSPERPLGRSSESHNLIYRGQADAEWPLEPAVLRTSSIIRPKPDLARLSAFDQIELEKKLLAEFVCGCDLLGLPVPNDSSKLRRQLGLLARTAMYDLQYSKSWPAPNLVGLMALVQHHNIPTRLLDWTRRSYVAAYFAASQNLRSAPPKNSRMAVWVLDRSLIQDIGDVTDGISQPAYPNIQIVTAPGAVSVNLAAQSGLFTLLLESGDLNRPVQSRTLETEFTAGSETHLWKLTIPSSEAEAVLDLCRLYGVTAATLFPGYDGVGFAVLDRARTWTDASLPIYF